MPAKKSEPAPTKHYVLDTNVLIHDPQSMFQFEDNVVWIPVEVLEELDRFKSESTTRGANAREVHRRLSERFRTTEQMKNGRAAGERRTAARLHQSEHSVRSQRRRQAPRGDRRARRSCARFFPTYR